MYDEQIFGKKHYGLAVLLGIIAIAIGISALSDPPSGIYIYAPYVTIVFGILTIVFFLIFKQLTLVTIIVYAFMFLRYAVSMLALHLENYPKGVYYIQVDSGTSLSTAIIMICEMIMIFFALYISGRKKYNGISSEDYLQRLYGKDNFSHLNIVLVGFIIVTAVLFSIYPALFNNYSFIVNSDLDGMVDVIKTSQAGLPSGFRWIGYTFGESTRYILIEYVILKLYRKYESQGRKHSRYWFFSVTISAINAMITNQRVMVGIFMSLVFFYQIYQLFNEKRKLFFGFAVILGSIGVFVVTITYWSHSLTYHSFSQMLQGYTNGFYNVYQSTCAYNSANLGLFQKIEMLLLGDGLGNVNLISMFIDSVNSSNIYNYYIYGSAINGGAVLPFISQMSYYFTPVIGPLFSFGVVLLAKKMEKKSLTSRGNVLITQFSSFVFAATPFMYNYSTIIHIFTVVVLPIWFLAKINKKNIVFGRISGL